MTTTVTIEAHVSKGKAVLVTVINSDNCSTIEQFVLQDGEKASRVIYDGREISVVEKLK